MGGSAKCLAAYRGKGKTGKGKMVGLNPGDKLNK